MFNKEFLKTLTILYVEDDESIRMALSNILTKVFANVVLAQDGEEGLAHFKEYSKENQTPIDIIVSDINMPKMDGIEMAENIRRENTEIPIIFTTAHGESDYLLKAINLKIAHYALKPINTSALLDNISNFCMVEYNKKELVEKSNQLMEYMDIINSITSIFKVDINGTITEANKMLCHILGYTKEELIGMHINTILHKDTVTKTFEDTLSLVGNKDQFQGKLKFTSKSGDTLYFSSTIITNKNQYNRAIEGYIYICLDQTVDEIEKQQTMQRVRQTMIQQRTKESNLIKTTQELTQEIEKIKLNYISHEDSKVLLSSLAKEKQRISALHNQVIHYEKEIAKLKQHKERIDNGDKSKKIEEMKKRQNSANERERLQSKIIELQAIIAKQESTVKQVFVD